METEIATCESGVVFILTSPSGERFAEMSFDSSKGLETCAWWASKYNPKLREALAQYAWHEFSTHIVSTHIQTKDEVYSLLHAVRSKLKHDRRQTANFAARFFTNGDDVHRSLLFRVETLKQAVMLAVLYRQWFENHLSIISNFGRGNEREVVFAPTEVITRGEITADAVLAFCVSKPYRVRVSM